MHGMAIEHVISRTVRDSVAMLDAIEGPGIGDGFIIARPARPYLKEVSAAPRRLRIAVSTDGIHDKIDPDCAEAARDAGKLCESLGHEVEDAAPAFDKRAYLDASRVWWSCGGKNDLAIAP